MSQRLFVLAAVVAGLVGHDSEIFGTTKIDARTPENRFLAGSCSAADEVLSGRNEQFFVTQHNSNNNNNRSSFSSPVF